MSSGIGIQLILIGFATNKEASNHQAAISFG